MLRQSPLKTAQEAMSFAEKEHKKMSKKKEYKQKEEKVPIWFDKQIEKESVSDEEAQELEELFKEFR